MIFFRPRSSELLSLSRYTAAVTRCEHLGGKISVLMVGLFRLNEQATSTTIRAAAASAAREDFCRVWNSLEVWPCSRICPCKENKALSPVRNANARRNDSYPIVKAIAPQYNPQVELDCVMILLKNSCSAESNRVNS